MRRIFFLILVFAASLHQVDGQQSQLSTRNKRAEKYFFTAIDAYRAGNLSKALNDLNRAVEADPLFTEAFILRGDVYADLRQPDQAIDSYQSAIMTNNPFAPSLYMILAGVQQNAGRYGDARLNYIRFIESQGIPESKKQQAEKGVMACDFALDAMVHPVPFSPVNMGDSINTPYDEYINAITADEERLYFTRKNPRNAMTIDRSQEFEEDFYFAVRQDTTWRYAQSLGTPINTHGNEGALSISPDGKYLFFAACNREDGFGSCDLYWSRWVDNHWSLPENLGPTVNSPQWDSQPSFSSDGKTLYFASKRSGGKGSSDIWTTHLQSGGNWSVPENLGDSVNTPQEEMAPFIHPDDQTLYFSSKGHRGMGGLDLFFCRKNRDNRWGSPVNLGYPINTHAEEITLVVNSKGNMAFISSDKLGGKGRQDVYKFPLYDKARPLLTTYFKGVVYDEETKSRLDARFELTDLEQMKLIAESRSDRVTGEFLLVLPTERNYGLNVSREGYLFYSENFPLTGNGDLSKPFIKNIPLKPIKVGEKVVLKNIFFDTDQYSLKDQSMVELDKLVDFLKKNPKLKIEISGHTDNIGTSVHNLELSQNRAKAVFDFLSGHGIDGKRMTYKGYGFNDPVDSNDTESGRANNRRTEFKVIGN
ncbi:MAG TPA: OmpA family protein [Bacteroidales bacterium]|nr:OmpA family protein [Bacteroidales bacterium]